MKIAAIDLGTNSIRLLKGIIDDDVLRVGSKQIVTTRLGRGIGKNCELNSVKMLSEKSMKDTVDVLKRWSKELEDWGVDKVSLMATSAVRDAKNNNEFIDMVRKLSGLEVRIISGELEAELGFKGVMLGADTDDISMIVDVGGGSTEIIVGDLKNGIRYAQSLDIGAVRMSEKFNWSEKIDEIDRENLIKYVWNELNIYELNMNKYELNMNKYELKHKYKGVEKYELGVKDIHFNSDKIKKLIGIGGTATSFATIDLKMESYNRKIIQGYEITSQRFKEILSKLCDMDANKRKDVMGLQAQRADIISAGGQIIYSVIEKFGFDRISISDFDNLEGLFASEYNDKFSKVIVGYDI